MEIDTAMAQRFLSALTGDPKHTFQTFDDDTGRAKAKTQRKHLARKVHGSLSSRVTTLEQLNRQGAGVFVTVNRTDGEGRMACNIVAARALFVDLDGAPVEPVLNGPLPPRIVVESSPGKWHCYWPVVDLPLERFTEAQKALAQRFNGDPTMADLARVLRLPGFLHRKREPFQSRLVECRNDPLTWQEVAEAFGLRDRYRLPDKIREGRRNSDLYKMAASARGKGVPEAKQLTKALQVNADTCEPPLNASEVAQIVTSAYRRPVQGVAAIPLAVLDSEAYRALDDPCRTLLLLAYRRADSFGDFCLPHSELAAWFPREDTLHAIRRRLEKSGLLIFTRSQYRQGKRGKTYFYRLALPSFGVGYSTAGLPSFGVGPEALQAVAPEALPSPAVANGDPKTVTASDSVIGRAA